MSCQPQRKPMPRTVTMQSFPSFWRMCDTWTLSRRRVSGDGSPYTRVPSSSHVSTRPFSWARTSKTLISLGPRTGSSVTMLGFERLDRPRAVRVDRSLAASSGASGGHPPGEHGPAVACGSRRFRKRHHLLKQQPVAEGTCVQGETSEATGLDYRTWRRRQHTRRGLRIGESAHASSRAGELPRLLATQRRGTGEGD